MATEFLGTGCVKHPHGWDRDCNQCRYVMAKIAATYRNREEAALRRLERTIYA